MNKFFTKLFSNLKRKSQYTAEALEPIYSDPFTIWGDKKKIPSAKAMESFQGWAYACIRAIAEEIAGMHLKVFSTSKEQEEIEEHDILDLLAAPNAQQTGYNLFYKTAAHLELTGNAYWFLSGVKNELGAPTEITLLNVGHVRPMISKGVFPKQLLGYKYREETREYFFEPYEVLHFEYPDPNDDFEGVGTVQSIAKWIDADNYAMEINRRFFLNGARIGGFLESDNAQTPQQLDYLTKAFESIYKGVDSAYKTAALPKGVKYTEAGKSAKDMDFVNLSKEMQKRILGGFRVPSSVLGVTEDVNRANAEATNYIFALRTIKPKMDQLLSVLNSFFVPRFGNDIILSYEDPVPENTQMRIMEMKVTSGQKQIKTVNEIRAEDYGLDPLPGGDELSTGPAAPAPNEEGDKGDGSAPSKTIKAVKALPAPQAKKKNKAMPTQSMYHRNLKRRQGISAEFAEAMIKNLKEIEDKAQAIRTKGIKEIKNADWQVLWKDFASRVGTFETKMAKDLQDLNNKQREIVINNLSTAIGKSLKGLKAVKKSKLLNKDKEVRATIEIAQPTVTDIYKTEGEKAGALVGVDGMDITAQEGVKTAIEKRMALMAESYTQTTLDNLGELIDGELKAGSSLAQITEAVNNQFDEWNGWRAEMVARTESFAAANSATKEAWKETGVVKTIKWYTADDEMVCDYCGDMSDTEIDISDNFFNKGDSITAGDNSMSLDYDDVDAPPLHVNCRCYIRPNEVSIED